MLNDKKVHRLFGMLGGLIIILALAGALQSSASSPQSPSLSQALRQAESVQDMDRIVDSEVNARAAQAIELSSLLQSTESIELKKRVCYAIGVLRLDAAAGALIEEATLEESNMPDELGSIPRWFKYPCLEALIRLGRPAERYVLGALSIVGDRAKRDLLLHALVEIDSGPEGARRAIASWSRSVSDDAKKRNLDQALNAIDGVSERSWLESESSQRPNA